MTSETEKRSKTREYKIWAGMIQRCTNPKRNCFHRYGARGITVSDSWRIFDNFIADMGKAPVGFTIERIDNDAGYSKDNCRWASRAEQARNTAQNVMISISGETKCLSDWCAHFGRSIGTVKSRVRAGMTWESALITGRLVTRTTECIRGHARSDENLYVDKNGNRHCRVCARENNRKYKERKSTPCWRGAMEERRRCL